jgi:hypothetical protein
MSDDRDWHLHNANGREPWRVELDGDGGGTINRYQLTPGPAQSGLCIKVASQAEAAKKLETEVEKLLGPEW